MMTLDIPGKKVFVQRDVRETPAASATATSVGLTDLDYVLLSTDADVTNERVLTMGEGLDMTDNGPGNTVVISGELATDTGNKGIATFSSSDFDVASGVVTIDDSGVDHDGTANFLVAEHRNWESSIAQNIHADNYTDTGDTTYSPGEGINIVAEVISGENATVTNKGIASFANADFQVSSGVVTLDSNIAKTFDGDTGTATTAAHNIDILGGDGISTVGASNDITITADITSETVPPIGAIIAWNKSLTSVPQTLPTSWRECDGSAISDAESPMNGQNLPDLNGGEFLRGNTTSEGTGGSETMAHTHPLDTDEFSDGDGPALHAFTNPDPNTGAASNTENRPPFFDVVWIMRIK